MPSWVWILMWVLVIGVVALLAVREVRAKRRGPGDVDRLRHTAVREAGVNQDGRGPNGGAQTWTG